MRNKMKCKICKVKEREGKNEICSSCRLKKWRKDNPDKIKSYLERTKKYRKDWRDNYYDKNKKRMNKLCSDWRKRTNYSYYNTPERKAYDKIRMETNKKYPLKGQKCEFCNSKAEERHHTTNPIEVDEFAFVCKYHHNKIHGKRCVLLGESE